MKPIELDRRINNIITEDEDVIICPYCRFKNLKENIEEQLRQQKYSIPKFIQCYECERFWMP